MTMENKILNMTWDDRSACHCYEEIFKILGLHKRKAKSGLNFLHSFVILCYRAIFKILGLHKMKENGLNFGSG